jgi:hypothetical protein
MIPGGNKFEDKTFWKDCFDGKAEGGIYFRSFDLNHFLKKIEATDKEVVGIRFDDNNIEIIVKQ